jgi:hypothetical protein
LVEFDVKDLKTRRVIVRCNYDGDLYTFPDITTHGAPPIFMLAIVPADLWHQRLAHPYQDAIWALQHFISYQV